MRTQQLRKARRRLKSPTPCCSPTWNSILMEYTEHRSVCALRDLGCWPVMVTVRQRRQLDRVHQRQSTRQAAERQRNIARVIERVGSSDDS